MHLIFAACLGLAAGIIVNYLADVLPRTRRLSAPAWWPLRTASAGEYFRKPRVILVLVASIATGLILCFYIPENFSVYLLGFILAYFALVAVIDIEHRIVMHPVSVVGAVAMGAIGVARHGVVPTILGLLAGFGLMLAFYYLGELLGRLIASGRGERWQETALGFGDVNLGGVIGLLMGWPGVVAALTIGIFAAGIFSLGYIVATSLMGRFRAFAAIPYAPFLCFGAVAMVLLGIYSGV